jgi:hypothetical protein
VALAQARYIAKALEAAANHRDEALAREAALREALTRAADDLSLYARHGITAFHGERAARDALTATATVAAARNAALVERGRLAGIKAAHADLLARGMNTSALIVACLLPDDDAPGGAVSEYERGRREGIEEARMAAYDLARDYAGCDDEAEAVALEKLAFQLKRAPATPPTNGGPR